MRRPLEKDMRGGPFGLMDPILDVMAALGCPWDELPDIIPEHPEDSVELRRHLEALFAAKGFTDVS